MVIAHLKGYMRRKKKNKVEPNIIENRCLACWDNINIRKPHVICITCGIKMHSKCEKKYRSNEDRPWCKCPHCQCYGTLEDKRNK